MIYAIGFIVAWFIVVAWHAYLQHKEDVEMNEDLRLYREFVYRPIKEAMWVSGVDPYRFTDYEIAANISLLKRTSSGLVTYFKPAYTNYTDNFGMIMPLGAYHKPGKWETHHGMIDLHWHREVARTAKFFKSTTLWTEDEKRTDLWKDRIRQYPLSFDEAWPEHVVQKNNEEIKKRLDPIKEAEEQIKKNLGISTDRDGKTPNPNTEA